MSDASPGRQLRVIVASNNPVKLDAAAGGFERTFGAGTIEIVASGAPSGVADQPWSDAETLQGATNRAIGARAERPDADYWVGIEGGLAPLDLPGGDGRNGSVGAVEAVGPVEAFAWVVVLGADGSGQSRTASFQLPPPVVELVRAGHELGAADDLVFGRVNSKQQDGAVGLLTSGLIDRRSLYEPAVVLALVPLARTDLYGPGSAASLTTGPSR